MERTKKKTRRTLDAAFKAKIVLEAMREQATAREGAVTTRRAEFDRSW
jgi:hypothetical protein